MSLSSIFKGKLMKNKSNAKYLTYRISADAIELLNQYWDETRMNKSNIVDLAIKEYLKDKI